MNGIEIRVGGTWLSDVGAWSEPVVTHRWGVGSPVAGPWQLDWKMDLGRERPSCLRMGKGGRATLVEAFHGPNKIWMGTLNAPDWDDGSFTAEGLCRQAERVIAFNRFSGYITETRPNDAIGQAIIAGFLDWSGLLNISSTPVGDANESDHLNYIAALLDAWALAAGKKWRVSEHGYLNGVDDPTTPKWHITPDSGTLGVADDDYVTDLYGRYQPSPGAWATAGRTDLSQDVARIERAVDLTGLGYMDATKAGNAVQGILNQGIARTGWTNGLTLTHGQITNRGDVPAHLADVRAGHMVRLNGVPDERGLNRYTDVVIEESIWNVADGTIQLNPAGLADRDLGRIIEEAGGVLTL